MLIKIFRFHKVFMMNTDNIKVSFRTLSCIENTKVKYDSIYIMGSYAKYRSLILASVNSFSVNFEFFEKLKFTIYFLYLYFLL